MTSPALVILAVAALAAADPTRPAPASPSGAGAPMPTFEVYASPQRLVALPQGRRLNLYCLGAGSPTVILEGGWSDSDVAWRMVQPLVARRNRVCAYDRAGLGFSDPAAGPRDTVHIVADLEALLKAADLAPPYVLVGYSMGGLAVRLFADRHLTDVAGMVLVEPSTEHQAERFAAVLPGRRQKVRPMADAEPSSPADPGAGSPGPAALPASVTAARARQMATAAYQQTILSELVGMTGAGADQVSASRRPYGPLPLIVLTGADNVGDPGYTAPEIARFKAVWHGMHDDLARLSSIGIHRSAPGATHLMVLERPELVAEAVAEVVAKSKQ